MKLAFSTIAVLLLTALNAQTITIKVYPEQTRAITGHTELNRSKYFSLADPGNNFENKVSPMVTGSDYFLDTLNLTFGRSLGLVWQEAIWGNTIREDANKSGFPDIAYMRNQADPNNNGSTGAFRERFGANLGVAYHDRHNAYPEWFNQYKTRQSGDEWIPSNIAASTMLTTNLLKYKYNDFFRPAFLELVNEPHWSFIGDQRFADWHVAMADSVRAAGVPTAIGGPCSSVGYYFRDQYQDLDNFTQFIDNTNGDLDFYSFHVYDFMHWDEAANDFTGRLSTGLPISGVLDALGGYMRNNFDKDLKMVISEHGGYILRDEEGTMTDLANRFFPGSGFDWEMERRSISNYIAVSSAIANTMAFMETPHIIEKSVPFILLESFNWNPRYNSSMMVADNFTNNANFVESRLSDFFKFFADANGHRIRINCEDPDLQHHAFLDDRTVTVLINNVSTVSHPVNLDLVDADDVESIRIKRLRRKTDFRPEFIEEEISDLSGITVGELEAISLSITLRTAPEESLYLDELSFYSEETAESFRPRKTFNVAVDNVDKVEYAYLRIGLDRPTGTDRDLEVKLNGTTLTVPMEDAAARYEDEDSYASLKIVHFDPSLLRGNNEVDLEFPGVGRGGVGSVVIRTGLRGKFSTSTGRPYLDVDFSLAPNPTSGNVRLQLPADGTDVDEVIVYNIVGAEVRRQNVRGNPRPELELGTLPAGTYFVVLRQGGLVSRMQKLIQQ